MKCLLAALGFKNNDTLYNKEVIINTLKNYANKVDIVIFGEAFLQGFYAATFDESFDKNIAISLNSNIIKEIKNACIQNNIAVSFGFFELDNGNFYSSQITVDKNGNVIDLFKRVSSGWKEHFANDSYKEGTSFHIFIFMNKKVLVGLCGDLWFEENVNKINNHNPDIVFWPVYTDYNYDNWNNLEKYEYDTQAKLVCDNVLYVNSYCLDKEGNEIAKGGAIYYKKGNIEKEIPSGKEEILVVEI